MVRDLINRPNHVYGVYTIEKGRLTFRTGGVAMIQYRPAGPLVCDPWRAEPNSDNHAPRSGRRCCCSFWL
jgi:hypothetical protein